MGNKRAGKAQTFFPLAPSPRVSHGPANVIRGLQVAVTNSTTTTVVQTVKPIWVTAVEIVILIAGIVIVGTLFRRLVEKIALKAGVSKVVTNSLRQWLGVLMIIGGVAGVAYLTGLSSAITTLTISGIAGLTISLALQTTLSNLIAGELMLQDGVIRLGDDVQFGGPGGVRGEVVKLSLRTTWIRTQDGVITVIGNSNLSAGPILNYSAKARLGKKLLV